MKALNLSLLVALAALASSAIFLWSELQNERAHAAELEARTADLNLRIAGFERSHAVPAHRRVPAANTFGASGKPPAADADQKSDRPQMSPWSMGPAPQRSEAMQKMMRAQNRAHNKRMYADVGAALGLTREQSNKLIDLITDQQTGGLQPLDEGEDPEAFQTAWAEKQRRLQGEIAELIGADKVATLEEYQKSLPARSELEMLSRQLEGYDAPLNEDQRKKLLKVMTEERERVPAPDYVDGVDLQAFQKTRTAWDDDYNARVAAQARGILDTEQLNAYTEYQQAQKDMRAQFATMMPAGPRRMIQGAPNGSVSFTRAAGGAVMSAEAVFVGEVPEPEKKK
jgi:hypothetical protein